MIRVGNRSIDVKGAGRMEERRCSTRRSEIKDAKEDVVAQSNLSHSSHSLIFREREGKLYQRHCNCSFSYPPQPFLGFKYVHNGDT